MHRQAREIRYFFYSQAFADGFRTTLAILLPALAGFHYGFFSEGLTIAVGSLCVNLVDAPGPVLNKRNSILLCTALVFFIALLTSIARLNVYILGIEIAIVCFFFSMFNAYGARAAAAGNAAILIMILTMDDPGATANPLWYSSLIGIGGLWYFTVSMLFYSVKPYRAGERILGDCTREIAKFLSIKSSFYNPSEDLDEAYKKLVAQQIIVNEKLDAVREILFKNKRIVREATPKARRLVMTFVETVDLFEDITASYYDYQLLRTGFGQTGILEKISAAIKLISIQIDSIGMGIQMRSRYKSHIDFEEKLTALKQEIDSLPKSANQSHLVLRKILVNLRRMIQRVQVMESYFDTSKNLPGSSPADHSKFISHQPLDIKIFSSNLSLSSSVFRHSLRVAIACVVGFIITKVISYGEYTYWILLTIAFILKPAFSLTRERNVQRIIGTVAGGIVGVAILVFIPNKSLLFGIMVLFMLLDYSFMRINYLAMVFFTTPFVIILFSFLGVEFAELARERIFDTVLGCAIAFAAGTFLFPAWERDFLYEHLRNIIKANAGYLKMIVEGLNGKKPDTLRYKLNRKQVYVASANLSASFQRMQSEPKSKQKDSKQLQQFILLNHILFSNIATVGTNIMRKEERKHPVELIQSAIRSLQTINPEIKFKATIHSDTTDILQPDDVLLKDQLAFIEKLCRDITKSYELIAR